MMRRREHGTRAVRGATTGPRRGRHAARVLVVLAILLGLFAGGTAVAVRMLVNRWENAFGSGVLLAPEARESVPPGHASVSGPLDYLLLGSDRLGDPAAGGRADAIIIVHVAADLQSTYLVSIPRDLLVPIPGHGDDKINAAFRFGGGGEGGAQLLSTTLSNLTGISFDGAAIVEFDGFRQVVDTIGGVRVCLDERVSTMLPSGCHRLTGVQALDLARQRQDLPRGDFDRMRNQQRLIHAIVDQAAAADLLTNPIRLDRTIRAVGDAVTVDTGGVPLRDLAWALHHVRGDHITGITLPSQPQLVDGVSYMLADPAADGLYRALRDSTMDAWAAANPQWRNN